MAFQLFCFTHAGGKAGAFNNLKALLSENIEVTCIEYPGHGTRGKHPLINSWETFLEDVTSQVEEKRRKEYVPIFLGYSMGSIVAYELIVRGQLSFTPFYFIGLSHGAPDLEWKSKEFYKLDENRFILKMTEFGGIDEKLIQNPRFLKLFLSPLKNDYYLIGTYPSRYNEKLDCPICFFYSPSDTSKIEVESWKNFTTKGFECHAVGNNHFLLSECPEVIAEKIARICEDIQRERGSSF